MQSGVQPFVSKSTVGRLSKPRNSVGPAPLSKDVLDKMLAEGYTEQHSIGSNNNSSRRTTFRALDQKLESQLSIKAKLIGPRIPDGN